MKKKPTGTRAASEGRLANLKAGYPLREGKQVYVSTAKKPSLAQAKAAAGAKSDAARIREREDLEASFGIGRNASARLKKR
jgi:hypothetical protein